MVTAGEEYIEEVDTDNKVVVHDSPLMVKEKNASNGD